MRTFLGVVAILLALALFGALAMVIAVWIHDEGFEQFSREIGNYPRVVIFICQIVAAAMLARMGMRLLSAPR